MKIITLCILFISASTVFASPKYESMLTQGRRLALIKHNTRAIKVFKKLLKTNYKKDEVTLHLARTYYAQGKTNTAIAYYKKVPKSSDYWLESLEELSWAYIKKGELGKSYAQIMTLLSPTFSKHVNAEAFYLASVNRYFVCDYQGVFKVSKQMKSSFKDRIVNLTKVKEGSINPILDQLIAVAKAKGTSFTSMAQFSESLPKYFYKDKQVSSLLKRKSVSKSRIKKRLQKLAVSELKEIQAVIEKMGVVEAEVIQRAIVQNNKPEKSNDVLPVANGKDTLSFPVENGEVWIDEINSYEVSTSRCPNRIYKEASL